MKLEHVKFEWYLVFTGLSALKPKAKNTHVVTEPWVGEMDQGSDLHFGTFYCSDLGLSLGRIAPEVRCRRKRNFLAP